MGGDCAEKTHKKQKKSRLRALRLEADVDRAVQNLEMRIRRLLSIVAGGDDEDDSSTGSSPPARSIQRKGDPSLLEPRLPETPPAREARAAGLEAVEVETHSV